MQNQYEILKYTHDRHPESHLHEYYEIFVSLSNEGKFFVHETDYQLRFGTIFILKPFEIHRCFCHGSQEYDRYVVHFDREHLSRLSTSESNLLELFDSSCVVLRMEDAGLARMLSKLAYLSKPATAGFGNDIERNIQFDSFLLLLARAVEMADNEYVAGMGAQGRIGKVLQYIHENYDRDITLDTLAQNFYISKSRLSQIFKDATGFSVGDYIITYRIKRACALLQSGFSVQDVGEMVGFNTSTHFIRMFKSRTGCSPGRFAKNSELREGRL